MAAIHTESTDRLVRALVNLQTEDEAYALLEDLCTIKEMQEMAQRLETAVLLANGKSYQQIAEALGVSTATISRVNRCLSYGEGGYRTALEKLKENAPS